MRTPFSFNGAFEIIFLLVIICILTLLLVFALKGLLQRSKNNHSLRLTVPATVVSKRTDVDHQMHPNAGDVTGMHGHHCSTSTTYYVTFQVESGDRMELNVPGHEFAMLAEGDRGMLSFQGTRYLGFERR